MWVDCDDECVLINTELHRQKFKNVEADPRVAVCIWDKDDPYHYIEVRGDVVEVVRSEPPRKHIDELAMRYFGHLYDGEIERAASCASAPSARRRPGGGGHWAVRFGVGLWCASRPGRRRGHVRALPGVPRGRPPRRRAGLRLAVAVRAPLLLRRLLPCLLTAAAAALAVTRRLRLGTGMLLAPYQRPERPPPPPGDRPALRRPPRRRCRDGLSRRRVRRQGGAPP